MATISKVILSGKADGKLIQVAATSSAGTIIHTAIAGTTDIDEIWLYACNTDAADKKLTIEWGGTTSPDDLIEVTIPGESGLVKIVEGLILQNGAIVRAFAETADVINIGGFVNRIDN